MFKIDEAEKITTHIGAYYLACIDLKKYTITVEPLANQTNCETTGKILGYRDPVKMDAQVWTNSVCNELDRLSQGWKNMREQTQYNSSPTRKNRRIEKQPT